MNKSNKDFKEEFKRRLYRFAIRLLKFIATIPRNAVSAVIIAQLVRSGTSILSNYIEALASSSKKEFTRYFQICLRSANESKVWLLLLRDTDNGDRKEIVSLLRELEEIANIFASSLIKLKGKK